MKSAFYSLSNDVSTSLLFAQKVIFNLHSFCKPCLFFVWGWGPPLLSHLYLGYVLLSLRKCSIKSGNVKVGSTCPLHSLLLSQLCNFTKFKTNFDKLLYILVRIQPQSWSCVQLCCRAVDIWCVGGPATSFSMQRNIKLNLPLIEDNHPEWQILYQANHTVKLEYKILPYLHILTSQSHKDLWSLKWLTRSSKLMMSWMPSGYHLLLPIKLESSTNVSTIHSHFKHMDKTNMLFTRFIFSHYSSVKFYFNCISYHKRQASVEASK